MVQTVLSKQARKKICQRYRRQPNIPDDPDDYAELDQNFTQTGFKQIYTIHGSCGTGIERAFMPFVHMLLPNKQETTYRRKAFKALMRVAKRNNVNLNPKIILTDFDSSQTHHSMDVSFTGAKISTSVLRTVRAQAPVSMKRFFDYVQSTCVLGKMEEHGTARLEIYLNHATNRRFGLQRITP
ncbi:conserved hypothetical protein [Culex quinquefasciatus]|uniref:Uncharacterized protein n=1 Tax=Culex quinquefasciatus TaxID=7176 RepID=B0XKW6_CULQU|nr:conserved hypothetical protein [Culex quinquefasciatus]|eukprot:XP_001870288.1 conserved hypothetical protein [Culex quinquefasciatus]